MHMEPPDATRPGQPSMDQAAILNTVHLSRRRHMHEACVPDQFRMAVSIGDPIKRVVDSRQVVSFKRIRLSPPLQLMLI